MSSKGNVVDFSGLSLTIVLFTAILNAWDSSVFKKYLGPLEPIQSILFVVLVGFFSLRYLEKGGQEVTLNPFGLERFLVPTLFSLVFGVIIILIDHSGIFSDSINVSYPKCLLFYPVMGYIVETLFHLLPISILSRIKLDDIRVYYLIAVIEPVIQLAIGGIDQSLLWASLLVFLHIFLINVAQLYVFRKYGFLSMYWLRFSYYLIWHEIWGVLRLSVLF